MTWRGAMRSFLTLDICIWSINRAAHRHWTERMSKTSAGGRRQPGTSTEAQGGFSRSTQPHGACKQHLPSQCIGLVGSVLFVCFVLPSLPS